MSTRLQVHQPLSVNPNVATQLARMEELAAVLKCDSAHVSHTHVSKSITLPVPTFQWTRWGEQHLLTMMARDNFHDLNLYVEASEPIALPLDVFYTQRNFRWYQEAIESKRNYCFKDWTDEEMNDPRITRVKRKNGNGWSEVRSDEKDRWDARLESTEWHGKHWSSGVLIPHGPVPFTDDTVFYQASHAFGEGIPGNAGPYIEPCSKFMISLNSWEDLTRVSKIVALYSESKAN